MKTLVVGASENPERYSYKAVSMLLDHGHEVVALGKKEGKIEETIIVTELEDKDGIDTVTLYLSPQSQESIKDLLFESSPAGLFLIRGRKIRTLSRN